MTSKFNVGQLVTSAMVNLQMAGDPDFDLHTVRCLARHVHGDWGDVDPSDARQNDEAVANGGRLHSAYKHAQYTTLWIITEHDRSVTTLLFPDDY